MFHVTKTDRRSRAMTVAALLVPLVLLAGCSSSNEPPVTSNDPTNRPTAAADTPPATDDPLPPAQSDPASQAGESPAQSVGFPSFASCQDVASVVPDYTTGMTVALEVVTDQLVQCSWSGDGAGFGISIQAVAEIPTNPDELGDRAIRDARLEALGGVGVWAADTATALHAEAFVPGVRIVIDQAKGGTWPDVTRETFVGLVLEVLGQ
jgi:hypothetical protein